MFRTSFAAAAFAIIATTVLAQSDLIAARKAVMEEFGKHAYRALPDMLKGTAPFNQAVVDNAFVQFAEGAKKLPVLYVESTRDVPPTGRYWASQKTVDEQGGLRREARQFRKGRHRWPRKIDESRRPERRLRHR